MIIWLDVHISPALAKYINTEFSIKCWHIRSLLPVESKDREIFLEAKKKDAIIITKDKDFIYLQDTLGSPPKIIWLTCGNTSNSVLREIFKKHLRSALNRLNEGEFIVEIM